MQLGFPNMRTIFIYKRNHHFAAATIGFTQSRGKL